MVAQPELEYPVCRTSSYRNQRSSCKEDLQRPQNPSSKVTHNQSFDVRKLRAELAPHLWTLYAQKELIMVSKLGNIN